ncbi:MAG: GAF domain-containing protein [Candidatus Onthomonas sp.]|nr:GAF domain-containing protein [Candidatus Onthomonas sp.]
MPADYALLAEQLSGLLEGERDVTANLANASALLNETLEDLNWVGFYLRRGEELVLGPFQGRVACIRIPLGRGVCGTAAALDEIQLVPDVHQFPGHIACDGASNSEIVLPLHSGGKVVAVLDIDSPSLNRFQPSDREGLLQCARIVEAACDWDGRGWDK